MMPYAGALLLLGPMNLGFPELVILLMVAVFKLALPVLIIVGIVRVAQRKRITRYCTHCSRGLKQPMDAPFCCCCGQRLP